MHLDVGDHVLLITPTGEGCGPENVVEVPFTIG